MIGYTGVADGDASVTFDGADIVLTAKREPVVLANFTFGATDLSWLVGTSVAATIGHVQVGTRQVAQPGLYSRITSGLSDMGRGYTAAFDQTYGPKSIYGGYVGQPFLRGLAAVGNSPLGDVGIGMSVEQSLAGIDPRLAAGGAIMVVGQRGIRALGGLGRAVEIAVPKGVIYSRIDLNGDVLPYIGQAKSESRYIARQVEHARDYRNADFDFDIVTTANPGADLDVAEHLAIQQLTGDVRANKSPIVSNLKAPVGPARRPEFGLPGPRNR